MFSLQFISSLFLLAGSVLGATNQVVTYPIPSSIPTNPSFTIAVKVPSGRWQNISAYLTTLNEVNTTTGGSNIHSSSMAYFDFSGSVEVSVTYNKGHVNTARIRPDSYNLVPEIRGGNNLLFTLTEPKNLMIQVNDDIFDALHLLSNPIETDVPDPNDPNVIYFGPGVHSTPDNFLNVTSGKTVYIAGGGLLTAQVNIQNVSDVTVRGRGVLYHSTAGAILAEYSSNIYVSDIISLNPIHYAITGGNVNGMEVHGLRAFSSAGWGDGIDFFCSQNILIDGVFMRNSDDNIAIYSHRWDYYGNTSNITLQNSSLWADVAHPINIGTHGNTESPETISDIVIRNIDILDHREPQVDYQGCIALNAGDSNLIQNVHISDVRVEDFRVGQLVNFRVMYNTMYNTSPGRGIANITLTNLSYEGTHANLAVFVGYDEERTISGVTFEGLKINGKAISDTMQKPAWYKTSDFVPMYANEHVVDLKFLA